MDDHECPIEPCTARVPDHMLMCGRHWRMVPNGLQLNLYAAWRRGSGAGTKAHADAMKACIEHVQRDLAGEDSPSTQHVEGR